VQVRIAYDRQDKPAAQTTAAFAAAGGDPAPAAPTSGYTRRRPSARPTLHCGDLARRYTTSITELIRTYSAQQ
jgi:hypothetical protein